tara:strand:- start:2130 stop:2384 length:255 start_codon:yes stop_codon:yes gene_type:complete
MMNKKNPHYEISRLQRKIPLLLEGQINESTSSANLQIIKEKTQEIWRQEAFWIKRGNASRYLYDLRQFLSWATQFQEDNADATS